MQGRFTTYGTKSPDLPHLHCPILLYKLVIFGAQNGLTPLALRGNYLGVITASKQDGADWDVWLYVLVQTLYLVTEL
jgi:hypothetical protein